MRNIRQRAQGLLHLPPPFYKLRISAPTRPGHLDQRDDLCGGPRAATRSASWSYLLAPGPGRRLRHGVHHRRRPVQPRHADCRLRCPGWACGRAVFEGLGVTGRRGNLVLMRLRCPGPPVDTDDYQDIYWRWEAEAAGLEARATVPFPGGPRPGDLWDTSICSGGAGCPGHGRRHPGGPSGQRHRLRRHHRRTVAGGGAVPARRPGHRHGGGSPAL